MMVMKFGIPDSKPTQDRVSLWTPWGVLHCARDQDAPEAKRKLHTRQWSRSAIARLPAHKPDQTPRR